MRPDADIRNLPAAMKEFRPTFLLAMPRIFEKVFTSAKLRAHADGKGAVFDRLVYSKIRGALGGAREMSISGGAPLGERLGHFLRGVGITIYEGYGLTETSPGVAINLQNAIRVGTVGRPLPGVAVRIADDNEILVRGGNVFQGYRKNQKATTEVLKDDSQSMAVGDGRPFIAALVTIDPQAFASWLGSNGKPASATVETLQSDDALRGEVRKAVDAANLAVSKAEAIKEFRILPREFTEEAGEMTPSLKIKRNVVLKDYADEIAAIYGA